MKVLIATDGSEFGRAAVEEFCRIASKGDDAWQAKIISVYEPPAPLPARPFALPADYYQSLLDSARLHAENAVNTAQQTILDKCSAQQPQVSTEVAMGRPAQSIVHAAKEWGADMIVVGSHGRGFWGKLTLGSVSDAVVHHAPCSVLIVRRAENE